MNEKYENDAILTKEDIAKRYHISKSTVDTWCSRSPENLPVYFKLGGARNSAIRWRLSECLKFEQQQVDKQQNQERRVATSLADLLDR